MIGDIIFMVFFQDDFKDPPNMDFLDIEVENKEKEEVTIVFLQLSNIRIKFVNIFIQALLINSD